MTPEPKTLHRKIRKAYKEFAKEGDRIHSLVCLSAEVQWFNEAISAVISRAGLSSFRVTTVHVHNDEKPQNLRSSEHVGA